MDQHLSDIIKRSLSEFHLTSLKSHADGRGAAANRLRLIGVSLVLLFACWFGDWLLVTRILGDGGSGENVSQLKMVLTAHRLVISFGIVLIAFGMYRLAEYKNVDLALKRSSKWFSTTIKSMGAALIAVDTDGNIIFINSVAQRLTGWRLDHAIGRPLTDICKLLHARNRKPYDYGKKLKKVIVDGYVFSIRDAALLESADGNFPYVTGNAAPIKDEQNAIIGAVFVLHDMTEFRKAEEKVRRLAAVVDQAEDIIVITDTAGKIQYVNPSFEARTGYVATDVVDHAASMLKSPYHDDEYYRQIATSLAAGGSWRGRFNLKTRAGGGRWLESLISRIVDRDGNLSNYVSISRDITREIELQNQLTQSQKMEAMGRLASGVAHDFNNILSIIGGFNDLIIADVADDESLLDSANEIAGAVDRASALVDQLLKFGRKDIHKPVKININEKIREMEPMLKRLVKQDIELIFEFDSRIGPLEVDQGQLGQVIMNLTVNASDAIGTAGKITIATREITVVDGLAEYGVNLAEATYLLLAVSDNGSGIDESTLSKIFEPFFTTKDIGKGTGLGLAIVFGFMKQIGGDVQVVSVVGEGTTFNMFFPINPHLPGYCKET